MQPNSGDLGQRYLPFIVVAAVLALLVVVTPSKGPGAGTAGSDALFTGEGGTAADANLAPGLTVDPATGQVVNAEGDVVDPTTGEVLVESGGQPVAGAPGAAPGSAGGPATSGQAPGTTSGSNAPVVAAAGDRSRCDARGNQKYAAYDTDVSCRPPFSGDNGGATMQGVTDKEIRYVWYNPPQNPAVNALLANAGFAREPQFFCPTMRAFERSFQKAYEMSGRKLVALDGPGGAAGSRNCDGQYKYFQSQCSNASPDAACARAEATTIATQLKPAFVIASVALPVFHEELAKRKTVVLGYAGSRARYQQLAPYAWNFGLSSERGMALGSQYYCNRLAGRNAIYGGSSDGQSLKGVKRHIGLIYPDNGDGAIQPAVDLFLKAVRKCGDSTAKGFPYKSDPATAQQQSTTAIGQLKADKVTTLAFCCDPVSYSFFLTAAKQAQYTPEHLVLPFSSTCADVVGQIYEQAGFGDQWRHAFGTCNFPINTRDDNQHYRRAYADGGGAGGKAGAKPIEIESFLYLRMMMQMIHSAGANLKPINVFNGMQNLPRVMPSKVTPGYDHAPPDPFTNQLDVSEVWWNPSLTSLANDMPGAMCHINEARRYSLGEWPKTEAKLFNGNAACAKP